MDFAKLRVEPEAVHYYLSCRCGKRAGPFLRERSVKEEIDYLRGFTKPDFCSCSKPVFCLRVVSENKLVKEAKKLEESFEGPRSLKCVACSVPTISVFSKEELLERYNKIKAGECVFDDEFRIQVTRSTVHRYDGVVLCFACAEILQVRYIQKEEADRQARLEQGKWGLSISKPKKARQVKPMCLPGDPNFNPYQTLYVSGAVEKIHSRVLDYADQQKWKGSFTGLVWRLLESHPELKGLES